MASLSFENGTPIIYVKGADGRRKKLRPGSIGKQRAETIRGHVHELEQALHHSVDVPAKTRAWLAEQNGTKLRERLADVGLCDSGAGVKPTLKGFAATWLDKKRATVGDRTMNRLQNTVDKLARYFGDDRRLDTITAGDAEQWRAWAMRKPKPGEVDGLGLAETTMSKHVKNARELFRFAIRKGLLVGENPFAELPSPAQRNPGRAAYIGEEDARKVLDEIRGTANLPAAEMRVVFVLARWAGLRVPSEPNALKWDHVDFAANRLRIMSPKTGERIVPLFEELREPLMQLFEQAPEGEAYVLPRARAMAGAALRKPLLRAIRAAGLLPWERLFHNLRASRQTDLCDRFPAHVAAAWLGNSEIIAAKHYLQVTDEHFAQALDGGEWGQKRGRASTAIDRKAQHVVSDNCNGPQPVAVAAHSIPPRGVEPLFPD